MALEGEKRSNEGAGRQYQQPMSDKSMTDILAPNPYKEIKHPVYTETLLHVILPQALVKLDQELAADHFIVNPDKKTPPDELLSELGRGLGANDVFGQDFFELRSSYINSSSAEEKERIIVKFRERLKELRVSDAEFEVLLYIDQQCQLLPTQLIINNNRNTIHTAK